MYQIVADAVTLLRHAWAAWRVPGPGSNACGPKTARCATNLGGNWELTGHSKRAHQGGYSGLGTFRAPHNGHDD